MTDPTITMWENNGDPVFDADGRATGYVFEEKQLGTWGYYSRIENSGYGAYLSSFKAEEALIAVHSAALIVRRHKYLALGAILKAWGIRP